MFDRLANHARIQAKLAVSSITVTKLGVVTNYDPANYRAKVQLQPEDQDNPTQSLTGWLPIFSPWTGANYGLFAPVNVGDMVEVQFQDGDIDSGIVCMRGYSDKQRPLSVESGEFWLVHKSGSFIKMMNDGSIEIHSDDIKIGESSFQKLVNETGQAVYNSHTHSDPQGGETGPPTQQMGASSVTANTTAS